MSDTTAGSCAGVGTVVLPWGMLCHAVSCHAADACRQWAPTVSPRRASVRAGYVLVVGWVRVWLCRAGVGVRLQGRVGLGSLMAPVGPGQCHGGGRRTRGVSAGTEAVCWGVLIHQGVVSLWGTPRLGPLGAAGLGTRLSCPLCSAAEVGAIRGSLGCPRVTMSLQLWDMSPGCPCMSVSLQHPGHILTVSPRGCVPGVSPQNPGHVPRVSPWPCPRAPSTHPQDVPAWLCPWGVPKAPRTRSQGDTAWPCPRGVPMAPRISPRGVPVWPCPRGVLTAPRAHTVPGCPQGCAVTVVAVRGPPGPWLSRGATVAPAAGGAMVGCPPSVLLSRGGRPM